MSEPLEFKEQKIFAGGSSLDQVVQFGSAKETTPVYSKDPDVIQQLPAFELGWQSAVLADKAPFMEEMNAVQYVLSRNLRQLQQERYTPFKAWVSTYNYQEGDIVYHNDLIYRALQNNINVEPTTDYNAQGGNWGSLYFNQTYGNNVIPNALPSPLITPTSQITSLQAPVDGWIIGNLRQANTTGKTHYCAIWLSLPGDNDHDSSISEEGWRSTIRNGTTSSTEREVRTAAILPVKKGQMLYIELIIDTGNLWATRYWFLPNPINAPQQLKLTPGASS